MLGLEADGAAAFADDPVSVTIAPVRITAGQHGASVRADLREAEFVDIAYVDSAGLQELHGLQVFEAASAGVNVIH